jgi:hypothetical protein
MIAYKLLHKRDGQLQSSAAEILPPSLVQTYVPFEIHFPRVGKFLVFKAKPYAVAAYGFLAECVQKEFEVWECEVTGAEPLEWLPAPKYDLKDPLRPIRRFWKTRKAHTPAPAGTLAVDSVRLIRKISF